MHHIFFIQKVYCLMLLLNLSTFRYLQFLQRDYIFHGTSIDQIQMNRFQVLVKYISSTCIALVLPAGFAGFFNNFLVIYFPFSQVHTIISSFFLKLGVNIPPFFNVATLKSWVYHRLNVFKLPGTVYHNRSSQLIQSTMQITFMFYQSFQLL